MTKLTICRGASGSGKSTWSRQQNAVVVSRDDIRQALWHQDYLPGHQDREGIVTAVEDAAIKAALEASKDCVVDDTNVRWEYVRRMADIGYAAGAEVELKVFDVHLDECLKRVAQRVANGGRNVPTDVIRKQVQSLKSNKSMQLEQFNFAPVKLDAYADAIVCDIDGTLAHNNHGRSFYDYTKVIDDDVDEAVATTLALYADEGFMIILLSGRDEAARSETIKWLKKHDIECNYLFMRADDDKRHDDIVKYELYMNNINGKFTPLFVMDDRPRVCRMWRQIGLKTLQLGDPAYEF